MTDELKMDEKDQNGGHPVQEGSADVIQGTGDAFARIVRMISNGITRAAVGTGKAGVSLVEATTDVLESAVRGAMGVGGNLLVGTKAIIVGVVRGTGEKEETGLRILSYTARIVIHHTAQLGGDLAAAAKGLVLGGIACARDLGVDRAKAASAAAEGAVEGAEGEGSVATERVCNALKERIGDIHVALPEPVKK